jgi:hypothetical protein
MACLIKATYNPYQMKKMYEMLNDNTRVSGTWVLLSFLMGCSAAILCFYFIL